MSELFALTGQYNQLYDMLTEDDVNEEVVKDTLAGIMGEIEAKGEGYVNIITRLEAEETACDAQLKMWQKRKKLRTNAIERLKKALVTAMKLMGITEIKAGATTIKVVNNGGKLPVMFFNGLSSKDVKAEDIPKEYRKTVVTETVDVEKVRHALENGENLGWAYIGDRGQRVSFK